MSSFPQASTWDTAEQPRQSGFEGQEKATIAYANEVPWHGLGQKLSPDADLETWKREADLAWDVIRTPIQFRNPVTQKDEPFTGRDVLVRSDTGQPLSTVTNKYHIVQPGQVIEFFRDFTEGLGAFKMETAGHLRGGTKVWALAKADDELVLDAEDKISRYLLLATSYDFTIKTIAQQTSIRAVCQNTLNAAYRAGETGRELRIVVSHRTKFDGDAVKQKMMLDAEWKAFGEAVHRWADKKLGPGEARKFFEDVFYPRQVRERVEFSEKAASRRLDEIEDFLMKAPGANLATTQGTVWGAVNVITFYTDHVAKSKNTGFRFDKAQFGEGQTLKARAYRQAMELVGA